MKTEEFRLARFLDAQEHSYATALQELRSGRKRSHWIWFVFPQLKGLGRSSNSGAYGLSGLAEARAYLADPVLGQRLREATEAMLAHRSLAASAVLGELDALKFRSCLTLFSLADPSGQLFATALQCFFAGERDARTMKLLEDMRTMAKYLISFPSAAMDVPDGEWDAVRRDSHAVIDEAKAAGVYVFGGGIDDGVPPALVSADGTVTDGGYPWAPRLDGGFTVLELASRDEAVAWAARLATACRCDQELRVFGFDPQS